MNLDTLVRVGAPPWQPALEAGDVEVWRQYDAPLVGTYKLGGHLVLFTVIGDTSTSLSVWAYVPVEPANEAAIAEAEFASDAEMREFVEEMFAGREAVFALARDMRIWNWVRKDAPADGGLLPAATDAISDILKSISQQQHAPSPEALFRAMLAQAVVTADELADI
jgi:hypothetical protein